MAGKDSLTRQSKHFMKRRDKSQNRSWPRETLLRSTAATAGQDAKSTRRDFEQEATERTEIQKEKSLLPSLTFVQVCRPFTRVTSSFESALCSLCYLLFKAVLLRASLCALCVLLWKAP